MATETAKRDPNYRTTIQGVDLTTGLLPTNIYVDEATHRLLVNSVISGSVVTGIDYDYVDIQQTSPTVDTYVFKTGGSGGTTVKTITVTYTSTAKTDLDTVVYS